MGEVDINVEIEGKKGSRRTFYQGCLVEEQAEVLEKKLKQ